MARSYKKRTASTNRVSYERYLRDRERMEARGEDLLPKLSEKSFEERYKLILKKRREENEMVRNNEIDNAQREIKAQPYRYLLSTERVITYRQAQRLEYFAKKKAEADGEESKITYWDILKKRVKSEDLNKIAEWWMLHRSEDEIYGGNYE